MNEEEALDRISADEALEAEQRKILKEKRDKIITLFNELPVPSRLEIVKEIEKLVDGIPF